MAIGAIYIGIFLCQSFQGKKIEYVAVYEQNVYYWWEKLSKILIKIFDNVTILRTYK